MDYNIFSSTGVKLLDDQFNKRAKLDTGTFCNYECYFCYYIDDLDKTTDVQIIKDRALKIRNCGMEEIDLSGGESAVHKSWFDILSYCKEIGFKNISALTNGSKFSNIEFCKKSKEHGLTELLFSLHGVDEDNHDSIVGRKGAFRKMLKAISNCQSIGIKVRINCTVTDKNAEVLYKYVELINKIMPSQLNFLPLNYWEDAERLPSQSYEHLSKYIKESIDTLNDEIEINVRYIPFCFMKGYERYVVGIYQHIYDRNDWNIYTYDIEKIEERVVETKDMFEAAKFKRSHTYSKKKECFDCKYFYICDGVEKKMIDRQDVYPEPGEKIDDVQLYRRDEYPLCSY